MFVYKITNKLNNKAYIGQTTRSVEDRWRDHCKKGFLLTKAIRKYGEENFSYQVVCHCQSLTELNAKEIEIIAVENSIAPNGYNLSGGGLNHQMHQSTKDKISTIHKNKVLSLETINKIKAHNVGKKLSQKTKDKISQSNMGRKRSKNACNNIALSLKKDKRRIFCKNNNSFYLSASEAGKSLNLDRHAINKVLCGKRLHHKGYIFEYEVVSAK